MAHRSRTDVVRRWPTHRGPDGPWHSASAGPGVQPPSRGVGVGDPTRGGARGVGAGRGDLPTIRGIRRGAARPGGRMERSRGVREAGPVTPGTCIRTGVTARRYRTLRADITPGPAI